MDQQNAEVLLPHYERIAHISNEFAQAAHAGEWELAIELHEYCVCAVRDLVHVAESLDLSTEECLQIAEVWVNVVVRGSTIRHFAQENALPLSGTSLNHTLH